MSGKVILTVDDSSSIRAMVAFTLKAKGFTVLEASEGNTGLNLLKSNRVDLILTDQNMPGMTGIEFIQKARLIPSCKMTPILMLTTEASDQMKQQGRVAGATGWLVKPFDPAKLIGIVNKVLNL